MSYLKKLELNLRLKFLPIEIFSDGNLFQINSSDDFICLQNSIWNPLFHSLSIIRYSKDETFELLIRNEEKRPYSFVIAEMVTCRKNFNYYKKQHTVSGFSRLTFTKKFPFVGIQFEEKLCILAADNLELYKLNVWVKGIF